ncbi:MAG: 50S ribosomal protein L18 [Planctomycetota bacterium]|jgi:large subunit ribosomal protein L18
MKRIKERNTRRDRRKKGIRTRIFGTPQRPRLAVFRSLRHIYVQLIDDLSGRTLVAVSSMSKGGRVEGGNRQAAEAVGKTLAERGTAAGIKTIVFDRSGYRYHGRIKALAEAARKGGLEF